jgi:hypothetical protein
LSGGYYVSGENRRRFGEKRLEGGDPVFYSQIENWLPDQIRKGEPGEPTVRVEICAARRMGLA